MVWDDAKPNGGFSSAKPWLPVPLGTSAACRQHAAGRSRTSLLEHYRRFLAFRSGLSGASSRARSNSSRGRGRCDRILPAATATSRSSVPSISGSNRRRSTLGAGKSCNRSAVHGFSGAVEGDKIALPALRGMVRPAGLERRRTLETETQERTTWRISPSGKSRRPTAP